MIDSERSSERNQKTSVLIPLDAEEALLALQGFRRTGAGELPFTVAPDTLDAAAIRGVTTH
jgi:hypothetical protein